MNSCRQIIHFWSFLNITKSASWSISFIKWLSPINHIIQLTCWGNFSWLVDQGTDNIKKISDHEKLHLLHDNHIFIHQDNNSCFYIVQWRRIPSNNEIILNWITTFYRFRFWINDCGYYNNELQSDWFRDYNEIRLCTNIDDHNYQNNIFNNLNNDDIYRKSAMLSMKWFKFLLKIEFALLLCFQMDIVLINSLIISFTDAIFIFFVACRL
jgi:hypothetical protein